MKNHTLQNSIAFINLNTVAGVIAWDDQLTAGVADSSDHLNIGDRVIAMRGRKVVAIGRITKFLNINITNHERLTVERSIRINLHTLAEPVRLTGKERKVLSKLAQATNLSFPKMEAVLPVQAEYVPHFETLFNQLGRCPELGSNKTAERHHAVMLDIIAQENITAQARIDLLLALKCRGALADFVFERDEACIKSDTDDMDLHVTRIVPWEACTDAMRIDPNNYVLIEGTLAENFSFGLASFSNNGEIIVDPAVDRQIFDHWILGSIEYPELSEEQEKYMAYHRQHVYMQWRTRLAKPLYVADQQS